MSYIANDGLNQCIIQVVNCVVMQIHIDEQQNSSDNDQVVEIWTW